MSNLEELNRVAEEVALCQKCQLYKTAVKPVPGNGSAETRLMFIGEAPGYWEDQKGIPFCGPAGQLLDELLSLINLNRSLVFVGNMLKHRPPDNRDPLPEEMEVCRGFLDRQIEIIQPETIVTLGRFSMNKFLPYGKITLDHGKGRLIDFLGKKLIIIPMFHPAAALRASEVMEKLKADFLKIPSEIERLTKLGVPQASVEIKEEKKDEQLTLV